MNAATVPWIILFMPLVAAAIILLFGKYSRPLSAGLAILSAAVACVLSWWLFVQPNPEGLNQINWISLPGFHIPIGVMIDNLSKVMLVVVNTIATLVFIYSTGYMAHEEGYWRYFAGLALFLFSMLGIVLADNFVMMFIFWELVGVSSYILIGHYYSKDSAADACKQAFLVNRIGDFGFMVGILMLWLGTGFVAFQQIFDHAGDLHTHHPVYLTVACIFIFCGTVGKSAQLPLHVWLPNSMEGPTPVSSLLHAATMVAAGVFMLARFFPVLEFVPTAKEVIAIVGGATCLFAALLATQQDDIKRILAYSTISQLGYMVLGIGVAPSGDVAMFHLFTHAFFKCLLFLCAGSVIVGMHHEQDIWKMGALKNKMPFTLVCMTLGTLALSGFGFGPVGFSGFYSKDLIIEWAIQEMPILGWIAVATAGLTAFYMFRLIFVVFLGKPKTDHAKHAHESPAVMVIPLILLAIPSVAAGWPFLEHHFFGTLPDPEHVPGIVHLVLLAMFLGGTALAFALYRNADKDPISIPAFANRLYIDDIYDWAVKNLQGGLANLSGWADRWIVDLILVQFTSKLTWASGCVLRYLQFGNLQAYAFFFGAGVVGLIYFLISK
ncbi:NADH-quinone oxidoreductase subunit L [soil metagenome]